MIDPVALRLRTTLVAVVCHATLVAGPQRSPSQSWRAPAATAGRLAIQPSPINQWRADRCVGA